MAQARGLQFKHTVEIVNVTKKGLADRIASSFGGAAQKRRDAEEGRVLIAIGAIPKGTNLLAASKKALTAGVEAYYDPAAHRLVSPGVTRLSPVDKYTLSHELTHALDDQTFDLANTNQEDFACSSDRTAAANAVIEGDAVWVSFQVVRDHFSPAEISSMIQSQSKGAKASTQGIPPFLIDEITWPYLAGQSFIAARRSAGSGKAVNQTFQNYPASTEQILHPEKYPRDKPVPVEVADYSTVLGQGWKPIYASDIGEEDLSVMLEQQLDKSAADKAAAGWGGATIRAWSKGSQTAVVLGTTWDSGQDAVEFASAMQDYIAKAGIHGEVVATPPMGVTVVFGSTDAITQTLASHVPA